MRRLWPWGERAPRKASRLAEALRDHDLEVRLAALRGLGRMACPEAGEEILAWVGEKGLSVPALPLQSALIQCCVERPQLLLPYVQHAEGPLRKSSPGSWGSSDPVSRLGSASICRRRP